MNITFGVMALTALLGGCSVQSAPRDATLPLPQNCMDDVAREKVRAILLDGLDQALKQHLVTLFGIWMKDVQDQPGRAKHGLQLGIGAYVQARASALRWSPPNC